MIIGVLSETAHDEARVALVPETVKRLAQKRLDVVVQQGCGKRSFITDAQFAAAGARVVSSCAEVIAAADCIARLGEPTDDELAQMRPQTTLLAVLTPLSNVALVAKLNARKITVVALDMVPRISMAQSMDVLSSQANIAGYWAVLAAAARLPRYLPMLMTAAGTITPARVLVMGVGVAGLQAIGTAKRLGAIVEASDVRAETKQQVESLGGKFLEVTGVEMTTGQGGYAAEQSDAYKAKQAEVVASALLRADIVITTALIAGRKAPILVTKAHVSSMKAGSVIVDLAARQGGNVEGCVPGVDTTTDNGVLILGPTNAPSALSTHASMTFSRNVEKLLMHLTADGQWSLRDDDDIQKGCVMARDGVLVHPKLLELANGSA